MKNTAIPLLSVALLLLPACTSSFAQVRSAVNQAPEWYGERRIEIRGEGYPAIADVPQIDKANRPGTSLVANAKEIEALRGVFEANPRAQIKPADLESIERLISGIRAEFEGLMPNPNMLTEAEIAAVRESFNVPRVNRGSTIRR